jgi:hypothetical protein
MTTNKEQPDLISDEYIVYNVESPDNSMLAIIYDTMQKIKTKYRIKLFCKWTEEYNFTVTSDQRLDDNIINDFNKLLMVRGKSYPILWSNDYTEMRYYRRLCHNFLATEPISGEPFLMIDPSAKNIIKTSGNRRQAEGGEYFLYMTFDNYLFEFESIWNDYLNGGTIRSIEVKPEELISTLECFEWSSRVSTSVSKTGNIKLAVRTISYQDYQNKIQRIYPGQFLRKVELPEVLIHEDSGFGLVKYIHDRFPLIKQTIPIIGTNIVYIQLDKSTYESIDDVIKDISTIPVIWWNGGIPDMTEIEPYTNESYENMDIYWKYGLILSTNGHWLSPTGIWRGFRYGDPLSREPFDPEILDRLLYYHKNIGSSWLQGFNSRMEVEIKTIRHSGFEWIYFIVEDLVESSGHLFWRIPYLDPDLSGIYNKAMEIITKAVSLGSLFRHPSYDRVDKLLLLTPEVLAVIEDTSARPYPDDPDEKSIRLLEDISALASVLK